MRKGKDLRRQLGEKNVLGMKRAEGYHRRKIPS